MAEFNPFLLVHYIIVKTDPKEQFRYSATDGWMCTPAGRDVTHYTLDDAIFELYRIKSEQTFDAKIVRVTTTLDDVTVNVEGA